MSLLFSFNNETGSFSFSATSVPMNLENLAQGELMKNAMPLVVNQSTCGEPKTSEHEKHLSQKDSVLANHKASTHRLCNNVIYTIP